MIDESHENEYHKFRNMNDAFGDDLQLMCRKGIYPYEWFDNINKFNHIGLPDKDLFFFQS